MTTKFEEKLTQLASVLLEKTREGKVSWNPSATDDVFISTFGQFGVSIRKDFFDDHILSFLDTKGDVFEVMDKSSANQRDYQKIQELFTLARRSAYNTEESLDRLLQELESR